MSALVSYLAPGAPATRRPARGDEPFLRPEFGFTPAWYRAAVGVEFGERWHGDVAHRRAAVLAMRAELARRFPGLEIGGGGTSLARAPLDLLTGVHGAAVVAGLFGRPIVYAPDKWPAVAAEYLSPEEVERLRPPDLDHSRFFADLRRQVEAIAASEGRVVGFLNWQGILNNAERLRGPDLFIDLIEAPERSRHLFDCVCTTMIEGWRRLRGWQAATGFRYDFATISNCLVNLVSPRQYRELLQPFDRRLARETAVLGVHNCAWDATPYLPALAELPTVGYVDMGLESNLPLARRLFPNARRAVMYSPVALAEASSAELRRNLERVASELAPCDVVCADLDVGFPEERVREVAALCRELSAGRRAGGGPGC